jgi:DNA-binding MarR family transcriptional regulator
LATKRNHSSRVITDLLSSKLHRLAALSAASAALRVERKYQLTLLEWRSLAQLGGFAPLSLKDLAHKTGMDKSYTSRTVGGLIERGYVASEKNDTDARGVTLRLTDAGQAVYEEVFADAIERNERLLRPLNEEQRSTLTKMLNVLAESARTVLHEERAITSGELAEADVALSKDAKKGAKSEELDAKEIDEIKLLVFKLNKVLGLSL